MASAPRHSSGSHDYRGGDERASLSGDEFDDVGDSSLTGGAAQPPEPSSRGPPRKRNRAALSCTLCRQRKVKCDRVIPCSQCVKRGDEAYCHLDPHKKGPAGAARQSSDGAARARSSHSHTHSHPHPPQPPAAPSTLSPDERHHAAHAAPAAAPAPLPATDPYEVAAIKQRLAQLEAALAAHAPNLPHAAAAAQQQHGYEPASGPSRFPLAASASQSSFAAPPFPASPPVSSASGSRNGHSASASAAAAPPYWPQSLFSQQDGVPRLPPLGAPSPGAGSGASFPFDSRFGRSQSVASSSGGTAPGSTRGGAGGGGDERASQSSRMSEYAPAAASKTGDVDSDTEDAALVLEGLAMGGRTRSGTGPPCRGAPQSKSSSAAVDGAASVRCPAEEDVIRRKPHRIIQDFVDADAKKVDIMSKGVLSRVGAGADATMADASVPDEEDVKSKTCPGEANGGSGGGGSCPNKAEMDELKDLPLDATVDKHGKSISPAKIVCRLLSSKPDTLLRLISGPETHLGFGLGWAFTAAEAAGDLLSVQKLDGCPGAQQREAVLRAIIRSLPSKEVADHLVNVYDSRVKVMAGMTIHMPSFRKELDALYALDSVEKKARVVNIVDPGWLAQLLSVFVLALHFHPCEESPTRALVFHLFDGRTIHLWRSAAHTCLVLARYQTSSSLAVLVTIIHLNLHSAGSGRDDTRFLSIAISNAREMGLHRLNMKERQPKAGEELGVQIRREMAKRIWAMLVIKDWGNASEQSTYTIHPDQYNTPPPLNLNDDDLCQRPLPAEHPLSVHTDMSFTLMQLKIAQTVRSHVDLQNKREREGKKLSHEDIEHLDAAYRRLLSSDDCAFYRVGSDEGAGTRLEVERFLVQQSIFHRLLRLHRPNLSSSRASCVLLARSILDLQRRIRVRCSIVDRLFLNLGQSFSAAVVLILDLLQTRPNPSMRDLVRGEVGEAVKALRHVASASHTSERSIRVLEALLAEEQARWDAGDKLTASESAVGAQKRKRDAPNGQRKKNLLSLALRVARAANGQQLPEDVEMAEVATPSNGGSAAANDAVAQKDAQSRDLFEQLTQANPRPYEPASFAHFDDPNAASSYMPGLDFLPLTPPDGDPFDITKFLAEYDSPPMSDAASTHGGSTHAAAPGMQHNDSFVSSSSTTSSHGHMHSRSSFGDGGSSSGFDFGGSNAASAHHSPQTSLDSGMGGKSASPTNGNSAGDSAAADALWAWMLTQGVQPGGRLEAPQQPEQQQPPLGQPKWQAPTATHAQQLPPASIAEWGFDAHTAAAAATQARHATSAPAMSAPSAAADVSLAAAPSPASLANIFARIGGGDAVAHSTPDAGSALKRSMATDSSSLLQQVSTPSAGLPGYNPGAVSTPNGWEFSFDLLS